MNPQLTLGIPSKWWLTSNQRLHWAVKAERVRYIRHLAALKAKQAGIKAFDRVHVGVFVAYPTRSKADPANASSAVKPALDGFTDAGMWEDDNSDHVLSVTYAREPTNSPKGTHTLRFVFTDQSLPF